jgi:DNA-binding response OmpR family regulator
MESRKIPLGKDEARVFSLLVNKRGEGVSAEELASYLRKQTGDPDKGKRARAVVSTIREKIEELSLEIPDAKRLDPARYILRDTPRGTEPEDVSARSM